MKPDIHHEAECSYLIQNPADTPAVLRDLWPSSNFLEIAGICFRLDDARISRSLHLYSLKSTDNHRFRLKLIPKGEDLQLIKEEKKIDGRTRREKSITEEEPAKILSILQNCDPIISAFAKERLLLTFYGRPEHCRKTYLKIGVDRIVAFSLSDFGKATKEKYYVEFEGCGDGAEVPFYDPEYVSRKFSGRLSPGHREDAKWRFGSQMYPKPLKFRPRSFSRLKDLTAQALSLLDMDASPAL